MKHFQPVFRHFFLEKFPEPATWFERRLAYTRSVATCSIGEDIMVIEDINSLIPHFSQKDMEIVVEIKVESYEAVLWIGMHCDGSSGEISEKFSKIRKHDYHIVKNMFIYTLFSVLARKWDTNLQNREVNFNLHLTTWVSSRLVACDWHPPVFKTFKFASFSGNDIFKYSYVKC